ncbi:MAG TPA: hypothetical protein VLG44_04520 [Chlamydiales bacterium]|nr:hypothetical protein [Chlamydiales bacterium]
MSAAAIRSPIPEHKGLDQDHARDWPQSISCTLPGCSHPIVDPVLLACRHTTTSHGKINAVYNRACLIKAMMKNYQDAYEDRNDCPGCKREIVVLKASQYKNHPLLKEIGKYNQTPEAASWQKQFDQQLQSMEVTERLSFIISSSLLTPTPLEITDERNCTELEQKGFIQRVANLCWDHFHRNSNERPNNFNLDVSYSIQNGKRFIRCIYRNYMFALSLNQHNRLSLEAIAPSTWGEYRDWALNNSTIARETRYYLFPHLKTALKVGSCFGVYAIVSFALNPYQGLSGLIRSTLVPLAAGFTVLKAYPYISKLFSRGSE